MVPINPNDALINEMTNQPNIQVSHKSVLYIFPPRHLGQPVIRPLQFNFGQKTAELAAEAVITGKDSILKHLTNVTKQEITPNAMNYIPVNVQPLQNKWYFIFIVEIPTQDAFVLSNKIIYFGAFDDEPINPNTIFMTEPTFNPVARLIFLKKLIINKIPDLNGGYIERVIDGVMDIPDPVTSAFPIEVFDSRPSSMVHEAILEPDDKDIPLAASSSVPLNTNPDRLPFSIKDPSPEKIAKSVAKTIEHSIKVTSHNEFQYLVDNGYPESSYISDMIKDNLETNVIHLKQLDNQGYPLKDYFAIVTLEQIRTQFNPEIIIVRYNLPQQIDVINQDINHPNIIFGNILLHWLPGVCEQFGIASIAFFYDSFLNNFEFYQASTLFMEQQHIQKGRLERFKIYFEKEIVTWLKNMVGDFVLLAFVNLSGQSYIQLNFLDFTPFPGFLKNDVVTQPFTLPVITDDKTYEHNFANLVTLIQTVSNSWVSAENFNLINNI